ncbi:hypothetical protein [Pedobacter sp. L105]|uniref:hypothetical protein n=1 Tax=Pedobacter sp. L105 TaxID=1641871 RepID=UPI00131E60F2|nr:hypothetical protein [Pedobacter sp. L105]
MKNTNQTIDHARQDLSDQVSWKTIEEKNWRSRLNRLTFSEDSSDDHYTVKIWPEGLFSYSPAKGFSGAAKHVEIEGRIQSKATIKDIAEAARQETENAGIAISASNKKVTDQQIKTKESTPSYKWIISGIILALILSFVGYQFIKKYKI